MMAVEIHEGRVSTQPGPDGSASFAWCKCGYRGPVRLGPDQMTAAQADADEHEKQDRSS